MNQRCIQRTRIKLIMVYSIMYVCGYKIRYENKWYFIMEPVIYVGLATARGDFSAGAATLTKMVTT